MFFMHMDVLSMGPQGGEEAFKMNLAKNLIHNRISISTITNVFL